MTADEIKAQMSVLRELIEKAQARCKETYEPWRAACDELHRLEFEYADLRDLSGRLELTE